MEHSWLYSPNRLYLREKVLKILLSKYGSELINGVPKYSNQSIYECAHDWVSQGNGTIHGISQFFEDNYAKSN